LQLRHLILTVRLSASIDVHYDTYSPTTMPIHSGSSTGDDRAITDSGFGSAPSSSSRPHSPIGQGTTHIRTGPGHLNDAVSLANNAASTRRTTIGGMQIFNMEVEKAAKDRFQDILERLNRPLLDTLRKCRIEYRPTAFKLMVLGHDEQTAKPWVVVLCPKGVEKKVKRFFQQGFARQLCSGVESDHVGFEVAVVGQPLRSTDGRDHSHVYVQIYPHNTGAWWTPRIMVTQSGIDHIATLGGYAYVYTGSAGNYIYGLTCGHVLSSEQQESGQSLISSAEDTDEALESDPAECDTKDESTSWTSHGHQPNDIVFGGSNSEAEDMRWASFGRVMKASFSDRARNRDWGLVELTATHEGGAWVTPQHPIPYHYRIAPPSPHARVLLYNSPSYSGRLSGSRTMAILSSGLEFVHVHTVAFDDATSKSYTSC
jgi:hypothetical protein